MKSTVGLVAIALLSACSGGGGSPTAPVAPANNNAGTQNGTTRIAFTFQVGGTRASATARNLKFIDPSSQGLVLTETNCAAGAGSGQTNSGPGNNPSNSGCTGAGTAAVGNGLSILFDISGNNGSCGGSTASGRQCTVYFPAVSGTNVLFEADFYNKPPVNGSFPNNLSLLPLSMYVTPATTVVAGQTTTITIYSQGIVASFGDTNATFAFAAGNGFLGGLAFVQSTNGTASSNLVLQPLPGVTFRDALGTPMFGGNGGVNGNGNCPAQDLLATPIFLSYNEFLAGGSSLAAFQVARCNPNGPANTNTPPVQVINGYAYATALLRPTDQPVVSYQGSDATAAQASGGYFAQFFGRTSPIGSIYPQLATGLPVTGATVTPQRIIILVAPLFGAITYNYSTSVAACGAFMGPGGTKSVPGSNAGQCDGNNPGNTAGQFLNTPYVQSGTPQTTVAQNPLLVTLGSNGANYAIVDLEQGLLPTGASYTFTPSAGCAGGSGQSVVTVSGPLVTNIPAAGGTVIFGGTFANNGSTALDGGAQFLLQPGNIANPAGTTCTLTFTDSQLTPGVNSTPSSFQVIVTNSLSNGNINGGNTIAVPSSTLRRT